MNGLVLEGGAMRGMFTSGILDVFMENGITFDTFDQESMIKALDYFHHQDLKAMGRKSIELEKPYNTVNCARREFDAIVKMTKQKA